MPQPKSRYTVVIEYVTFNFWSGITHHNPETIPTSLTSFLDNSRSKGLLDGRLGLPSPCARGGNTGSTSSPSFGQCR